MKKVCKLMAQPVFSYIGDISMDQYKEEILI
jgi:hypothetical protein